MEPIIFNRADIRDLAREMIARGFCTGVKPVESDISDFRARYASAIKYLHLITLECPQMSSLTYTAGDYVQTGQGYQKTLIPGAMVENAIAAIMHEMCENCSVKPVCYSQYDEFELREMEECSAAFQYIQIGDYEFVRDRAYELGIDAAHLHIDGENQLQLTINGSDQYRVKFRVYFGDLSIGEIE
jgi:hypothetical protein